MTQPEQLMVPSTADAPTLTLACAVLMASEYPQSRTPDQATELAVKTVDIVMILWDEIIRRITVGPLISPSE